MTKGQWRFLGIVLPPDTRKAGSHIGGFFFTSMAQFVPAYLAQTCQAVIPIKVFNKCPHDRTPLGVDEQSRPASFQDCFLGPKNGFVPGALKQGAAWYGTTPAIPRLAAEAPGPPDARSRGAP